jgi:hypothetical protein
MVTMNKSKAVKIEGPVVDKKGKPTEATLAMLQPKPVRKAKAKVVIVPEKPKNPIQIRHIRAEVQPAGKYALVGSDTVTDCGRIVVKQMTRVNPPTGATVQVCPHCMEHGHEDKSFQIVRGQVKLLAVAANKAK